MTGDLRELVSWRQSELLTAEEFEATKAIVSPRLQIEVLWLDTEERWAVCPPNGGPLTRRPLQLRGKADALLLLG